MSVQRAFYCIFGGGAGDEGIAAVADFYVQHFGFEVAYESDWFMHLHAPGNAAVELGIMKKDHDIVPKRFAGPPRAGMLTLVVDDVDAVHARFVEQKRKVHEAPRDLFYGQRRMLTEDPAGTLLDISTPVPRGP